MSSSVIFQDTSLVQYILEKLFQNTNIHIETPSSIYPGRKQEPWILMRRVPKIMSLKLVNTTFRDVFRTTKFKVPLFSIARPLGSDPYMPLDIGFPMDKLGEILSPQTVYLPTIGNAFSNYDDTKASGIRQNLMDAEYVNIECLDGFLTLEKDFVSTNPVLPNVKRMRIGRVGHTGMVSRIVIEEMFTRSQSRAVTMMNLKCDMTNMGSIEELVIESPLPVRMERNVLPGRMEYYFNSNNSHQSKDPMCVRSMNMIIKKVLNFDTNTAFGIYSGTQCGNSGTMIESYKLNRDLGNIYLSNLDFSGVRKVTLRAYECLGPPVSYLMSTAHTMGLRQFKATMHKDKKISDLLLKDLSLLLGRHLDDTSRGNYYPGYRMMMNMFARSRNLQEIIYVGVRDDVPEAAFEILAKPWKDLAMTKHDDGSQRKPFKVYVQTVWYRIIPNSNGRVSSGVVPFSTSRLLFDSSLSSSI